MLKQVDGPLGALLQQSETEDNLSGTGTWVRTCSAGPYEVAKHGLKPSDITMHVRAQWGSQIPTLHLRPGYA
jgi:hypothetical protein